MKTPQELITKTDFSKPYDLIQDTINTVVKLAKGFDYQISVRLLQEGSTRYANDQVTQHTDIHNLVLNLKLAKGKKISSGLTTTLNPSGLEKFVKTTSKSLGLTPEISFFQGFPDPVKGNTIDCSGLEWTPEERVQSIIEAVQTKDSINENCKLAGHASEIKSYSRIVSSTGIDVDDAFQINYFKVNAIAGLPDKRGYSQEENYWRYERPNYSELTTEVVNTALHTIDLLDLPAPKDYEVLLDTPAVGELISFILYSIDPISFHEGNSFASDRIGDHIFDNKLTLENLQREPSKATLVGSFDNEGIPTHNTSIIENGVLKVVPYNSFYASKYLQDKNLVNGYDLLPVDKMDRPIPTSIVMKTGTKNLSDQIQDIDEGLYVKTFWYTRFTIRKEGGLTGLTRNGLFYIKNGEIQGAVRNLRYTESFLNAFGQDNILDLGNVRKSNDILSSVPSVHLKKFHFSSVAHSFS